MKKPIIEVEGLSKTYRLGATVGHDTLRDAIAAGFGSLFGRGRRRREGEAADLWALRDVSFEVGEGEVIGVIGRNGAGKSTLLKILSRITDPTSGVARIRGRVASLLEVGTGFHPELTGRENIFLNGAILGMTKAEIKARFDDIVAFAEIDRFLDTPVKRYSSGMYVRLAFAVAAHLEPEVLIVDEVLAVGDASFQKKCLGKMKDVSSGGRTVLFVSHNMSAVQSLCGQAIWLDKGEVRFKGEASLAVSAYLRQVSGASCSVNWESLEDAPGNGQVRLKGVHIGPDGGDGQGIMTVSTPINIAVEYLNYLPGALLNVSLVLYNIQETCIFNTISEARTLPGGLVRAVCHIPGNLLNDDLYKVRVLIVKDTTTPLLDVGEVATFEVSDDKRVGSWFGKWVGAVRPDLKWDVETT
ncbi:MAG: ATP-binding cassette domain-containing protein [Nitrospirae bacterium]|nr:ATP-binding cassette domain-containing protein [Nitrospirota bacterium]